MQNHKKFSVTVGDTQILFDADTFEKLPNGANRFEYFTERGFECSIEVYGPCTIQETP